MTARDTYNKTTATAAVTGVATQNNNAMKSQVGLLSTAAAVNAQNNAAMVFQTTIAAARDVLKNSGDTGAP